MRGRDDTSHLQKERRREGEGLPSLCFSPAPSPCLLALDPNIHHPVEVGLKIYTIGTPPPQSSASRWASHLYNKVRLSDSGSVPDAVLNPKPVLYPLQHASSKGCLGACVIRCDGSAMAGGVQELHGRPRHPHALKGVPIPKLM